MVDYRIPLYKRLENVKAKRQHANNLESPGMGWDGEDERHRVKVIYCGSDKWPARNWRNVQYCDDVKDSGIDHTGWFTDEDQDEKIRGVVVQLPARKGEERWLAGYEDGAGNYVFHCDHTYDEAKDAARTADSIAENLAEREREYRERWQAKREREDAAEELAGHLEDFRELWKVRHDKGAAPIMEAVRESLRSHLEDIRELREKIEKSENEWGSLEDVD